MVALAVHARVERFVARQVFLTRVANPGPRAGTGRASLTSVTVEHQEHRNITRIYVQELIHR